RPSNVLWYIGDEAPDQVKRNTLVMVHDDTVAPHPNYHKKGIDPLTLRRVLSYPSWWGGLGAGDMKASLVSQLMVSEGLKSILPKGQGVTMLAVGHEELQSQGMHALQREDLLKHVTEAICLEIQVGSTLGQLPVLLAGRPGRVELQIGIEGMGSHTG